MTSSNSKTAKEELRAQVYERLGRIALALGSPGRLKLIQLLAQSPRSVEELSQLSGQSMANTSQHLQRLAREGIVSVTKAGLSRIYRIRDERVLVIWESLQELGRELAPELREAEDTLTDPDLRTSLSGEEVLAQVKSRKAILLDVRAEGEAEASSVEGALAIPLSKLKGQLGSLPKSKTIFVFCRGRYCSLASDAVTLLRAAGLSAYRLQDSPFRLNGYQHGKVREAV
ncbi:MAG: metalloregulator ArsR/SmtB family transcription factor [Oligoflexia bacterium]|nr:metalloregulator ArsR/SmtB family transcription factor [Oligoflexia bacterium]